MDREEKIRLLELYKQKQNLAKDRALQDFVPSLIQEAYLLSKAKTAALIGSNQCGKSTCAAVDTLIPVTGIIPDALKGKYDEERIKEGFYWISSITFQQSRDVMQDKVKEYCPKRMWKRLNKDENILYLEGTESRIGFRSADQGRERFQGVVLRQLTHDEEPPLEIRDEGYMRLIALEGYERFSFTPLKGLSWAYTELWCKAGKYVFTKNIHRISEELGQVHTLEEIKKLKERRVEELKNTSPEANDDIELYTMTIYDNKFLSDIAIQKTEQKYAHDPEQYRARVLGQFSQLENRGAFNHQKLRAMRQNCPAKFLRGEIEKGRFVQRPNGNLVIFKEKKPIGEGHYVIGADVAEGLEKGDYSCAQVLDHRTGEQVAIWHGKTSPEKFADILIDLGTYFNLAHVAPERNFHGFGVVKRMRDRKYKRLYSTLDLPQGVIKNELPQEKKYGWLTDPRSREMLVMDLAVRINEGKIRINDTATIEELMTFTYNAKGKAEALKGCFDDRVMALGIALQVFINKGIRNVTIDDIQRNTGFRVSDTTGY